MAESRVEIKKILVVDDEPDILETLRHFLKSESNELHVFQNPKEALKDIESQKLDLIITDLKMPDLDGESLIKLIRGSKTNSSTPIVILSGHITPSVKNALVHTEHIHYMEKPIHKSTLLQKTSLILACSDENMQIDVTFVNPLLNGTIKTLSTMANINPTPQKIYLKNSSETSGDISGLVGLSGTDFRGNISISFKESCFLSIVSKMLSTKENKITDEIKDAAGELINVIFGQAKKVLNDSGFNIEPAIPSVITGKSHAVYHPSGIPVVVIPFETEFGSFKVEVCGSRIQKKPQK